MKWSQVSWWKSVIRLSIVNNGSLVITTDPEFRICSPSGQRNLELTSHREIRNGWILSIFSGIILKTLPESQRVWPLEFHVKLISSRKSCHHLEPRTYTDESPEDFIDILLIIPTFIIIIISNHHRGRYIALNEPIYSSLFLWYNHF